MSVTARFAAVLALVLALGVSASAQNHRQFRVCARKYAFSMDSRGTPARLTVQQDDLVQITLAADDIPHSFTIDDYRIAKRVEPGKPISFEFRADHAGTFRFYCNLEIDEGCRKMEGTLVVAAKDPR